MRIPICVGADSGRQLVEEPRNVRSLFFPPPCTSQYWAGWEGLRTMGMIYRSREIKGQVQESSETLINRRDPKVRDHAKRIRERWGVKNKQHWTQDVTFSENLSQIRKGSGTLILSVFRCLALYILQRDTAIKDNTRGKQKR